MHRSRFLFASVVVLSAGLMAWAAGRSPVTSPTTKAPATASSMLEATTPVLPPAPMRPTATTDAASRPATDAKASGTVAHPRVVQAAPAPGVAGRVVAIDPETGQLAPPSEQQLRELSESGVPLETSGENAVMIYRPNGWVVLQVGPKIQDYLFAQIGPDGKTLYGCGPVGPSPEVAPTAAAPQAEDR